MAKYKVVWTEAAVIDLRNIVQYISLGHPEKSRQILKRIKINARELSVFPLRGRIVPEFKVFSLSIYRELIIKPWRLIYRIEDKIVYVLTCIDSRRDLEDVLLDRFLKPN